MACVRSPPVSLERAGPGGFGLLKEDDVENPEMILERALEEALEEAVRREAAMIDARNRVLWRPEEKHA